MPSRRSGSDTHRPWLAVATLVALALGASFAPGAAAAQAAPPSSTESVAEGQPPADSPADETRAPDPHDPAVPAGALRAYIDACRSGDYRRAAGYLDLSRLPVDERATEGPRLARQLKIVLDQKLWIDFDRLSELPVGAQDDGLPPDVERVGAIEMDHRDVEVLLKRVAGPGGEKVWKIAPSTVARIPALYDRFGYGVIGDLLPRPLFEMTFLEIRLIQWIGLLILLLAAGLAGRIVVALLLRLLRPIVARTRTDLDDRLLGRMVGPLRLLTALATFSIGTYGLRFAEPVYVLLRNLEKGLALLGLTWIALRVVDVGAELIELRLTRSTRAGARAIVPLARRAAKVVLLGLAFVGALQTLGFNVTGLLAGLGVGGLAVALAAQKSIENLFGGVTLIVDQPVRVGDFCRFGDGTLGTVEEVGLRSTRIRTLDRTLVSVPNSRFSEFQLENFAARDQIRLVTLLGLRYETSADQMRFVLAELRKVLLGHPRIADEPLRVRFAAFGAHSLDVEVYAMVETTDFNEFCAIREDLYLRFMDVVENAGTGFAFPSQTLYLGRDGGLDAEKASAAEAAVSEWREKGRLPFPDFPASTRGEMRRRLDYPPRGSSGGEA